MSQLTGSFGTSITLRFKNDMTGTLGSAVNWTGDFGRTHQINSATTGSANQALVLMCPGNYDVTTLTGAEVSMWGPTQVADAQLGVPEKVFGLIIEHLSGLDTPALVLAPGDTNPLNLGTITVQPGGHASVWFPSGVDVDATHKNIKITSSIGAYGRLTLIVRAGEG